MSRFTPMLAAGWAQTGHVPGPHRHLSPLAAILFAGFALGMIVVWTLRAIVKAWRRRTDKADQPSGRGSAGGRKRGRRPKRGKR